MRRLFRAQVPQRSSAALAAATTRTSSGYACRYLCQPLPRLCAAAMPATLMRADGVVQVCAGGRQRGLWRGWGCGGGSWQQRRCTGAAIAAGSAFGPPWVGCSAPRVMGLVRGRTEQRRAAPLPQLAAAAASAYKALQGAGKAAPLGATFLPLTSLVSVLPARPLRAAVCGLRTLIAGAILTRCGVCCRSARICSPWRACTE